MSGVSTSFRLYVYEKMKRIIDAIIGQHSIRKVISTERMVKTRVIFILASIKFNPKLNSQHANESLKRLKWWFRLGLLHLIQLELY